MACQAAVEPGIAKPSPENEHLEPQPLFVFSVTRSGSTLLQRILATYDEIAAPPVSEPWILIPQLYSFRKRGIASEYTHPLLVDAIHDFAKELPGGEAAYLHEIRELILRLYARAANGGPVQYYLDKTPSYFFIVDDVMRLFPNGRFIFLWRNPLSIAASLMSWDEDRWDPARYRVVLFDGLARLVAAWRRHSHRACAVRYEDLVTGEEAHWRRLMGYLDLDFDPDSFFRFDQVQLRGGTGDPFGSRLYSRLSDEPITKWKRQFNNPLRKAWAARYLGWLRADRLSSMGYQLDALAAELHAIPTTADNLTGDSARLLRSLVKEPIRVRARRSVGLGGSSALRYVLGSRCGCSR